MVTSVASLVRGNLAQFTTLSELASFRSYVLTYISTYGFVLVSETTRNEDEMQLTRLTDVDGDERIVSRVTRSFDEDLCTAVSRHYQSVVSQTVYRNVAENCTTNIYSCRNPRVID